MSVKKQEIVDSSGKKIQQKKKKTSPPKGSKEKNQYNADLGAISGVTLMNPFREVLVNYFSKFF